jgi:hypothetical protein
MRRGRAHSKTGGEEVLRWVLYRRKKILVNTQNQCRGISAGERRPMIYEDDAARNSTFEVWLPTSKFPCFHSIYGVFLLSAQWRFGTQSSSASAILFLSFRSYVHTT